MRPRAVALHFSGGKDSALALSRLLADERYDVRLLVTTASAATGTSTVHGLPPDLLARQADSIGIPLEVVTLTGEGLDGYVEATAAATRAQRERGIEAVAFGDLSASGVLELKRAQFEPLGVEVLAPLWGLDSWACVEEFLGSGITARTCVVDAGVLDASWCGRLVDREFVDSLPPQADPCGELGEYHSFVTDAPFFARPVPVRAGEPRRIERRIGTTEGVREFAYWVSELTPEAGAPTNGR